ncbi:glycine cleavage T C-terminal barrel domain-containing protein [soil metagenome]
MPAPNDNARAVDQRVAHFDRSDRVRLEILGPDRSKFLHNLTTNDLKKRPVGQGCESFVTSLQGKTLGYATFLIEDDRVLLRTDPGGLEHVSPHFLKYGALDEVEWLDVSDQSFEHHLAGPKAAELLALLGVEIPAEGALNHGAARIADRPLRVARESLIGPSGFTVIGDRADAPAVLEAIRGTGESIGLAELTPRDFEALRIEAGTPVFGQDVTEKNLPQEVGRDDQAISFVKGCYLGQETVARIDALGHVNRLLKGLRIAGDTPPPPGSVLKAVDKEVGTITSASISLRSGEPIALAYVRSTQARPGTTLTVLDPEGRETTATVADLPMFPGS